MQQFESFSANVSIVGKDLQRAFYRLFYLQLCDSSGQLKKHCVKDLLAIWEMLLQENSRNHNSYWFSYKIAFILFLSFLTNQKQESGFSKMVVWQQEIFLSFIYSESPSSAKSCQIQQTFKKEFSYMLFLLVL